MTVGGLIICTKYVTFCYSSHHQHQPLGSFEVHCYATALNLLQASSTIPWMGKQTITFEIKKFLNFILVEYTVSYNVFSLNGG
jgi:hypothetical protein